MYINLKSIVTTQQHVTELPRNAYIHDEPIGGKKYAGLTIDRWNPRIMIGEHFHQQQTYYS